MTLASAEGLTETQAKTAATLQLISKLEPFTYIIQVIITTLSKPLLSRDSGDVGITIYTAATMRLL